MELGVYSFGDVQQDPVTGQLGSTAQAMRNLVEAVRVADEVGLAPSGARAVGPAPGHRGQPGVLGDDDQATKDRWWGHWATRMEMISAQRGFPMMSRNGYRKATSPGGALFVGHPEEVAERIIDLHRVMGHDRQILEMDYGHVPQKDLLHSIELLGTEVKPLVDAELGTTDTPVPHPAPAGTASAPEGV